MIRLSLDLTPKMNDVLDCLTKREGITKSEMLRRAIALYSAVKTGEKNGEQVSMVKDGKILVRLTGF